MNEYKLSSKNNVSFLGDSRLTRLSKLYAEEEGIYFSNYQHKGYRNGLMKSLHLFNLSRLSTVTAHPAHVLAGMDGVLAAPLIIPRTCKHPPDI